MLSLKCGDTAVESRCVQHTYTNADTTMGGLVSSVAYLSIAMVRSPDDERVVVQAALLENS